MAAMVIIICGSLILGAYLIFDNYSDRNGGNYP